MSRTNITKHLRAVALTTLLFTGSGCGYVSDLISPQPEESVESPADRGQQPDTTSHQRRPRAEGVEITWQVPSEKVDGFVVRYGYDKLRLDAETKVRPEELKAETDPEFGPVYRYTIKNVRPKTPIFVSVAAFVGDRISDFTDVTEESGQ